MDPYELNREVGNIDLFLLDQVLKHRFRKGFRILDAGCGEARNAFYFLKNGYDIYGIDKDPMAIRMAKMVTRTNGYVEKADCFIVGDLEELPFSKLFFDAIISVSVLHFCRDSEQFNRILTEFKRVLKSGGLIFLRMNYDHLKNPDLQPLFRMDDQLLTQVLGYNGFRALEPVRWFEEKNGEKSVILVMERA
jgi:SAM-dependent methyltransferase